MEQSIQELKGKLPNPEGNWEDFAQWWQTKSSRWRVRLRDVMIKHHNIGHDWQFSHVQKKLLQDYYETNRLLVDCLNSDCYVSRAVREEIEASLLLPIAAIEEQFPNQRRQR